MAGEGIRFVNKGYKLPKPLIPINGIPMVVRAAKCLPSADLWIFICKEDHVLNSKIEDILNQYFSSPKIISVDFLTEGQASTCLLAKKYLRPNDILTIGEVGILTNEVRNATIKARTRVKIYRWSKKDIATVFQKFPFGKCCISHCCALSCPFFIFTNLAFVVPLLK